MLRSLSWMVVLALPLALADARLAEAQKKPMPREKEKELGEKTTEKMVKAGQVRGTIASINESKKSIKLKVKVSYTEPNMGAIQAYARAQREYQLALAKRDFAAANNHRIEMAKQQAQMYTPKSKDVDYDIQAIEEVNVRTAMLPEKFDDKGKLIKKFTKEELKELKGDPKLPGYKAEFGDLVQGQLIEAQLVRKKGEKAVRPKKKGKDDVLDVLDDHLPQASMIIILRNPLPSR